MNDINREKYQILYLKRKLKLYISKQGMEFITRLFIFTRINDNVMFPHPFHFRSYWLLLFFYSISTGFCQQILNAEPYGGQRELKEFIKYEMVYPTSDYEKKIEGTVVLSFVVKPDGKIGDLKVDQSVSPKIDSEAIRIFKKILWNPCTEIGKPIACLQAYEFKFNIKKYKKYCKNRGYNDLQYPHVPVDTTDEIFSVKAVDIAPKPIYSSVNCNFNSFIGKHLKYPELAFKQNVSGTVKLKFVVEPTGRISNIVVEKPVGGGCTEEAIRVVKLLEWSPGIVDEMAVRTFMELNITFDIGKQTVGGSIPSPGQVQ